MQIVKLEESQNFASPPSDLRPSFAKSHPRWTRPRSLCQNRTSASFTVHYRPIFYKNSLESSQSGGDKTLQNQSKRKRYSSYCPKFRIESKFRFNYPMLNELRSQIQDGIKKMKQRLQKTTIIPKANIKRIDLYEKAKRKCQLIL